MKKISRLFSVLYLLSLLLSLFIIPMNVVTAYHANGDVLSLNFNDGTGISGITNYGKFSNSVTPVSMRGAESSGYGYEAYSDDPSNKYFYFWNRRTNGNSVELGTKGLGMGDENAFVLKPSTEYKLTYKYKVLAGTSVVEYNQDKTEIISNFSLTYFYGQAANVSGKARFGSKSLVDFNTLDSSYYEQIGPKTNYDTAENVPDTFYANKLTKDTEWQTVTYTFTTPSDVTGKDNLYFTISAGPQDIFGNIGTYVDPDRYIGVAIDDVTLVAHRESDETKTYVYNFINDVTGASCYSNANHNIFSGCQSSYVSGSVTYTPDKLSAITNQGMVLQCGMSSKLNASATWRFKAYLRDTDVNLGHENIGNTTYGNGWFRLEADTFYEIKAKYKLTYLDCDSASIAFGLSGSNSLTSPGGGVLTCVADSVQNLDKVSTDWQYLTTIINGNGTSVSDSGDYNSNAGKYVCIVPSASENNYNSPKATFLIESVTVTVYSNNEDDSLIKLDTLGGSFEDGTTTKSINLSKDELYYLPTPTREGYVFAGWTRNMNIALGTNIVPSNDMTLDAAPATVVVPTDGFYKYYALWAIKEKTFDFGNKTEGSKFNGDISESEVTQATGWVSTHFSLVDYDGDNDYEIRFNSLETASHFKVTLADWDSETKTRTPYVLREGVNYTVEVKVKRLTLHSGTESLRFGVVRAVRDGFGAVSPQGDDEYNHLIMYRGVELDDPDGEYETISVSFTNFGMFNTSYNGSTDSDYRGIPHYYKDVLAFVGYSGEFIIDSITVKANYYENNRIIVNCSDEGKRGGTVDVDYLNKTITVKPDAGYALASDGIKLSYNYHIYDSKKYGKYSAQSDQVKHITEAYGYVNTIYNYTQSDDGTGFICKYEDEWNTVPDGLKIEVLFIKENDVSCSIISRSIKLDGTKSDGSYSSAGIRFRGRMNISDNITEAGFLAIPTEYLDTSGELKFFRDGVLNNKNARYVKVYTATDNLYFKKTEMFYDYQIALTGLTSQLNKYDMRDTKFTVVMYLKTGSGSDAVYTYSNYLNVSWIDIFNEYDADVINNAINQNR